MTSHMGHRLPEPDDAAFERCMDALDADGLEVRPEERAAFATIHEFGLLPRILPVVHRAMDMGALSAPAAADARRMVRHLREDTRPTAHRATFRAPEVHVHETRLWELDEDGLSFTHTACGASFGPFVDSRQTTDQAVAHGKDCEVRDV